MNNIKSARSIKIAGGGIAGLSAAIKLKLNGFDPIIYEKENKIGLGRHDDFEGIENWIFSNEMQPFFKKIGFDFNKIDSYPIYRFTIHTISKEPFTIFQNKYLSKKSNSNSFQSVYKQISEDEYLYVSSYNKTRNQAYNFSIEKVSFSIGNLIFIRIIMFFLGFL